MEFELGVAYVCKRVAKPSQIYLVEFELIEREALNFGRKWSQIYLVEFEPHLYEIKAPARRLVPNLPCGI